MVSNTNCLMVETSSTCDSPSVTEILILELKSCLDSLQQEQEIYKSQEELDAVSSDDENNTRYKWLADTVASHKLSKQMLDDLTLSEITDICQKISDREIVSVLREMHNQAHLGVTPNQLLSHVKFLLSESLISHQQNFPEHQTDSGRSTPTGGRHRSFSGVLAGLKAFRRNRATAAATGHSNGDFDIEARQTTV